MATYNWSYRPDVPNKYGIVIDDSADDVRPSNAIYVAHWGNDDTGNGSRMYPYKTLVRCVSLYQNFNGYIIPSSGVYREVVNIPTNFTIFIGDGNVTFDISYDNYFLHTAGSTKYINIKFKGSGSSAVQNQGGSTFRDCYFEGVGHAPSNDVVGCVYYNVQRTLLFQYLGGGIHIFEKNTFINCSNIAIDGYLTNTRSCIFYRCNLTPYFGVSTMGLPAYSLFYLCNFKLSDGQGAGGGLYPIIPEGYEYFDNIEDLREAFETITGTVNSFFKSNIGDPKFNNLEIGDFTLALDSPAKNMSFFGTYIGTYSIALPLSINVNAMLSAFENDTNINLIIANDSITLDNKDLNGSIITKPIDNTKGREIKSLPTFGINADRNGEYVDSTPDLSDIIISAGTALKAKTPYLVGLGSIDYGVNTYQDGDRLTTDDNTNSFTTATGGILREIIEAPTRENVEVRFSDGALTTVDNTATLEVNARYFVEGNSVTYNGDTYPVGSFVKVLTGITSFTGSGLLRKVFSDSDPYFYFEINQKPMSNNVGDIRTGDIIRGNGDKDFDRTNEFPVSKKFIQIRYTIQHDNLTP